MMKGLRAKPKPVRHARALVCVLFLAWATHPAFGLSFDPYGGCDELCRPEFWVGATGNDVAAALAETPGALSFLRVMLWLAVEAENTGAMAALLRAGAPPNARRETGHKEHILQEAARRSAALVAVLVKAGALPGLADETGRTPLHGRCDGAA